MSNETDIQLIASQLRAASPNSEWNAAGVDRSRELAQMFLRAGINDFSSLTVAGAAWDIAQLPIIEPDRYQFVVTEHGPANNRGERQSRWVRDTLRNENLGPVESNFAPTNPRYIGLQFLSGGRAIGFLGEQDQPYFTRPLFKDATNDGQAGYLVAWSSAGHGHVGYYLTMRPGGGFAVVPLWGSSSDASYIRTMVIVVATFVLTVYLPAAGVGVSQSIGAAVMGAELAASYPALASIVGNVVVSTALSGGDVEQAVRNSVTGYFTASLGGVAGNYVLSSTQSATLARVASAAVSAYASGRDVGAAVLQALAVSAANPPQTPEPPADYPVDYESDPYNPDPGGEPWDWWNGPAPLPDTSPPIGDETWFPGPVGPSGPSDPWNWWDGPAPLPDTSPPIPDEAWLPTAPWPLPVVSTPAPSPVQPAAPAPAPGASPWWQTSTPVQIVGQVTAAAMQALQLVNAWRAVTQPVNRNAQTVVGGRVQTVTNDGYIRTQNGSQISNAKPPVGEARMTVDGYIIVNNGDGTFTRISPDGQSQRVPYSGNIATMPNSVSSFFTPANTAIAAAVGIAVVLATRGRK